MASAPQSGVKRLRIYGKTSAQTAALSFFLEGEDPDASRAVYLVTFPHPGADGAAPVPNLVAPGTLSREQLRDAILASCRAPEYDPTFLHRHPGFVVRPLPVKQLVVFREYHAPDDQGVKHIHYHVALLLVQKSRFVPLKRSLMNKYKLATHWSCTHNGYWSAVRYGIRASEHKPMTALDPAPLAFSCMGPQAHPPLDVAAIEPTTAAALAARRKHREQVAGERRQPEPRTEDIDFWPVVVRSGLRPGPEEPFAVQKLMAYAKTNCSHKMVAWLFKNQDKIGALMEKVWAWEGVDRFLADATRPRFVQFLQARQSPCVCAGRWMQQVQLSLAMNRISIPELCKSVLSALERGRSENVQVPTLAGRFGGEGKSLFFAPLRPLFGADHLQERPAGGGFSLMGLEGKKVALLDEWTFFDEDLPLPHQLLWLEGKPVPVQRPQSNFVGHTTYRGDAPIFVTSPEASLAGLCEQSAQRPQGPAGMLLRRLMIFSYTVPLPPPPPPRIAPCPRCFACLVTAEAARA